MHEEIELYIPRASRDARGEVRQTAAIFAFDARVTHLQTGS